EIVAGGPQTTGNRGIDFFTLKGCYRTRWSESGTPSGCKLIDSLTGGLRSARPPATICQPFGLVHFLLSLEKINSRPGELICHSPLSSPRGRILNVVVHRELERVRPQAQRLNLAFAFVFDPAIDQALREHI